MLKIAPCKYRQCIFYKGTKAVQWREDILPISSAGTIGYLGGKKRKEKQTWFKSYTKQMKDSNVKWKNVNLLADNIRENLQDLGPSKVLLDTRVFGYQTHNPLKTTATTTTTVDFV